MMGRKLGMSASILVLVTFAWMISMAPPLSAASSDTLPDDWTGLISLEWESGIPADSPLHQQVEFVSMEYEKRWHLYLTFHAESRGPNRVRYRCSQAEVDYYQTSATVGKNGAVTTREVWKIEEGQRTLGGHQCNLLLVVDSETKKYKIEVGGFEIPDAKKTGQIVMSVAGRTVSEPINKETDVTEPIRFEGQYTVNPPPSLIGRIDARVDPPAGVDMTHETLGGTIDWYLRRGACPDVVFRCFDEARSERQRCQELVSEVHEGTCDDRLYMDLDMISRIGLPSYKVPNLSETQGVVENHCSWEYATPEFDAAVNAYIQCEFEWDLSMDECDRLCP